MANLATYEDIIADIKDKFGRKSAAFGSDTDTSIRSWIWQFEADIYSRKNWPFLKATGTITTTSGTQDYVLANDYDFGSLYSVYDETNLNPLGMANVEYHDYIDPAGSASGTPDYFFLWGVDSNNIQEISFYPIPGGIHTIKYRYTKDPTPTDIETNGDNDDESPNLPVKYRRGLVDAVLEELLQKDTNPNADRVNIKYQQLLLTMIADYAKEPAYKAVMRSTDDISYDAGLPRFPNNYPCK